MELDAARDRFTAAYRAAQDHLLDVMNAQRDGHPDTVRAALAGLVEAQRLAVDAHQLLVDAADLHQLDPESRSRLDLEHLQLSQHLADAEHELARLATRPDDSTEAHLRAIDLTTHVIASPSDMVLVADRLQRAAHVADRAGAPLLVGPLLDAAHLLRRTAVEGDTVQDAQAAADLAAVLLGYRDHLPLP
ncbi:hypothetical protein [Pseudonocardia lacus]|uniref:hypothetical protein n=1 Tax=Pseudonocardia lacus TaxID=2835865 RepID=UPI001BDC9B10|nr:hypothetical protein [Pseudonocardia lacus]